MSVGETCPRIEGLTFIKGSPVTIGGTAPGRKTRRFAAKDVYLVGVTDEPREKVEPFVAGLGSAMEYAVALDTSQNARRSLLAPSGAQGIPHAFIMDHNNRIVYAGHPMDPGFESALHAAAVHATDRVQKRAYPPVTDSLEQLMALSVKELKGLLQERGIDHADCFEKADLAKKVVERCSQVTYYR